MKRVTARQKKSITSKHYHEAHRVSEKRTQLNDKEKHDAPHSNLSQKR